MLKEDVDTALENAANCGGDVPAEAMVDETYGGYIGYISDLMFICVSMYIRHSKVK